MKLGPGVLSDKGLLDNLDGVAADRADVSSLRAKCSVGVQLNMSRSFLLCRLVVLWVALEVAMTRF